MIPVSSRRVAVVGGGPAGLMAAERLVAAGARVDLYDAKPSVGRKFLLAGKGGLNLTHSEPTLPFLARFAARREAIEPMLRAFGPAELRAWALGLGVATFVGSSGRVFPSDLKAAPLLRAWLHRLRVAGVVFHMRQRWVGFGTRATPSLLFDGPHAPHEVTADAVVLVFSGGRSGASWSRLGSDGAWQPWLAERGVDVAPLRPSNCGFDVSRLTALANADGLSHAPVARQPGWSDFFRSRFAGQPVRNVGLALQTSAGGAHAQLGEFIVTETGVEGSLVYALSGPAREAIDADGRAVVLIDLLPGRSLEFVRAEVARPRGSRSLSTHLKSRLGIDGVKAALLHELLPREAIADGARLAGAIKSLPLTLDRPRPIDEAISSAGGVRFEALDDGLMLNALPGVFCAGEMLDWEAPTGGYLLSACFATGVAAAEGVLQYLTGRRCSPTPV
jgi:predicted flavoprotein YhiN